MSRFAKAVLSAALAVGIMGSSSVIFAGDSSGNTNQRRALDRPLPEIKFVALPLNEVFDFLADATGSNFSVDWKALDAAHIEKTRRSPCG